MTSWATIPVLLAVLGAPTGSPEPVEPPAAPAAPAAPAPATVDDGPVMITSRVSPDPSHIGDVLEVQVTAAYPRGVTVNLPSLLSFDPLHQVSVEESEPEATGEGLRKVFTLRLQHFAVGPAEVPGFPLTWVGADGEVHTVDVPPKPFTVDALLANETEPQRRDEDPPISIEYPNTLAETVIYSALATLLVAMFAWLLWGRMRRRERPVVLPPPIAPHEQALGALRELENGELLAEGRFPSFYLELTEIAKGYMEGRFAIEALDRTTDEIRRELLRDTARIQPLSADEVVAFLQRCDLVKFARFEPDPEEAREALTRVRDMVERSMVVAKKPEAPVLPPDAPSARSPA